MTDAVKKVIKRSIIEVLSEHKSIKRQELWAIVRRRSILDENIIFLEDIRGTFENTETDDRELRRIVDEMITEGAAIGSSPGRGYFNICSEDDFREAVISHTKPIQGHVRKIRQLEKNTEVKLGKQISYDAFYGDGNIGETTRKDGLLFGLGSFSVDR